MIQKCEGALKEICDGGVVMSRPFSVVSLSMFNKALNAQLAVLIFHVHRGGGGKKNGTSVRTKLVWDLALRLFISLCLLSTSHSSFLLLCSSSSFLLPPPNQAPILLLHCAVIKQMMEEEGGSSECSSGCQSGWTAYLDHSSSASLPHPLLLQKGGSYHEEEEDLSMVSDASSGPPHFHEEDDEHSSCYLGFTRTLAKKRRVEAEQQHEQCSLLDDTASSPFFSFPKASFKGDDGSNKCMNPPPMEGVFLEFSCGFSVTDEQGNSTMEKQMRLLHSSAPAKQTPARPVKRFP